MMKIPLIVLLCLLAGGSPLTAQAASADFTEIPATTLRDKIRGGLLGQILGNLNGLPHEMKYIHEPGKVTEYLPALPEGARTDDDTDFEWVYIVEMQRQNQVLLPSSEIANLWKTRINKRIWCSNQYARQLMDLGLTPPLTGRFALNPWADFNISGQFLCETFGLLAPAMPKTAAQIGLNYTRVAIDLEPAQTTQLFTSMIATAFVSDDFNEILGAGLASIDSRSRLHEIIGNVRTWHQSHPNDWKATRRLVKETFSRHNGAMRDRNGYELNTASTIAALLYGQGDFVQTLIAAFNFGWDCDNTAATAGTIVGVMKGHRWMMSQGWQIVDRYRNTTRENMPLDETISSFADRLIELAENVITQRGGARVLVNGSPVFRIRHESPANLVPLPSPEEQLAGMRKNLSEEIETSILQAESHEAMARAAYLAVCLDLAPTIHQQHPKAWRQALAALTRHENVLQALYYQSDVPGGPALRAKASEAGLQKPKEKKRLW